VASSPSPTDRLQKHFHLSSPLRQDLFLPPPDSSPTSRTTSRSTSNNPDPLQTRLALPPPHTSFTSAAPTTTSRITILDRALLPRDHDSITSENTSHHHSGIGTATPSEHGINDADDEASLSPGTVSLSHVLLNAVILQEFILEIAALLQVRACVWGEVEV